jgi:hypothetical protein
VAGSLLAVQGDQIDDEDEPWERTEAVTWKDKSYLLFKCQLECVCWICSLWLGLVLKNCMALPFTDSFSANLSQVW